MNARRKRMWLLAVLLPAVPTLGLAEPLPKCQRMAGDHLGWVHSGAFFGDQLVLADSTMGGLHVLTPANRSWTTRTYPGNGTLEFDKSLVVGGGESAGMVTVVDRLVELDASVVPVRGFDLAELPGLGGPAYFLQGATAKGPRLIGVVSVSRADGRIETSVSELTLDSLPVNRPLRSVATGSSEFSFYTTFPQYGASLDTRLFWLVMESPAHVLEAAPEGGRRLDLVPAEWREVPPFRSGGPEATVQTFARLERQSFLAGLFGQGRELFLLHREPLPTGGVRWQLAAFDPDQPARMRRLTLPTTSPWITLVPGPKVWALLEQGQVEGAMPSKQRTTSVLLLPSAWFTAPVSPLSKTPRKDLCP